jgi:hypothetical protein
MSRPTVWVVVGKVSQSTFPSVTAGDVFALHVVFDRDSPDLDPSPTMGRYETVDGFPFGFHFQTAAVSLTSVGRVTTTVQNRDPVPGTSGGQDIYNLSRPAAGPQPSFTLHFQQETHDGVPPNQTALTSDSLLSQPPSPMPESFVRIVQGATTIMANAPFTLVFAFPVLST